MAEQSRANECPDFCGDFLGDLKPELQGKVIHVLHDLLQKKYVDAFSMCEGLLKEVNDEADSTLYGIILKRLCLSLLKASETETAIKLVEQKLNNDGKEDFETLLTLGVIYDKKGDYDNTFATYQRANNVANENGDNLQGAVSLLKMAASNWHLNQPEQSRKFLDQGQRTFEQFSNKETDALQELLHLVDYYKTLGYLNKVTENFLKAKTNYLEAHNVIKKNFSSTPQELKVLSQLSLCYTYLKDDLAVDRHNQRALEMINNVLKDSEYISSHSLQIIHIMSKLAFSYKNMKSLERAAKITDTMLNTALNYLGSEHLEVARIASDNMILCQQLNQPRRTGDLERILEKSLRDSNYKDDDEKMKLYVRELTDALSNFAFFHTLQSNYASAEEKYKEALEINMKVYGESNPRTAKTMRFLGRTYNKWGKPDLAKEYLRKSLTITEKYYPEKTTLIESIRSELERSGTRRKTYRKIF